MKLINIKDWEIQEAKDHGEMIDAKTTVVAIHTTCKAENIKYNISWFSNERPVCYNCSVKVPDMIQTLIFLHDGFQ